MARGDIVPPDDETMSEVAEFESAVVSGRVYREGFGGAGTQCQISGQAEGGAGSQMSAHNESGATRPRRGAGRTTLRLRVSDETYRVYRALEQDYVRRTPCRLGFLGFLCRSVWDSWHASLGRDGAYASIYARDRYRCSSPVCRRSDVTPHHLRFRSQGGDDTEENVASLCVWCHLEGVHGGRIRALPPASNVRWILGEEPILVVQGRRKQELGRAA
jgi:HNH endonuclease